VARSHPNVLADPPPRALFLGFGDSTLNFDIRVFIPNLDNLLGTKHDLHMMIIEKFRELDIEIAFPQRDLHIRSIGELREAMVERGEARRGEEIAPGA
jgi:potassium efflux system protein